MILSKFFIRCPKTNRIRGINRKAWPWWTALVSGFIATVWYAVRVLPKPSRASYPCMKAVFPISMGFLTYCASLAGSVLAFRKARFFMKKPNYLLATLFLVLSGLSMTFFIIHNPIKASAYTPSDGVNKPVGTARGIFPGRVVWSHDSSATLWDGTNDGATGYWFDEKNLPQEKVNAMMKQSILCLSGKSTLPLAWDALFKYFNEKQGKGPVGYQAGEKIAIKINMNTARTGRDPTKWTDKKPVDAINATPQSVYTVVDQLVNQAGVPQNAISVYDATRYITNYIYDPVHADFPGVHFVDSAGGDGFEKVEWSTTDTITYAKYAIKNNLSTRIPTVARDAAYIINLAIMKGHGIAGMTLGAKNHFGSIKRQEHTIIKAYVEKSNKYNPLVDLMGFKHFGEKTLLFMIDALYGSNGSDGAPSKWKMAPFNNHWRSSLFLSLDDVALESVGFDFMNEELASSTSIPYADCFLHEAAMADRPPSATVYAPNGDGVRLKSLGVHEHWNSAIEKKYSRNLGTGNGIELVYLKPADSGTAVRQPAQQILSQTQKQFRVVHAQSTMVEFSSTTTGRYVIVDAMGKTKMTGLSEPGQNQITIASWPKGNYYIRYFSDNGLAIDRITVK